MTRSIGAYSDAAFLSSQDRATRGRSVLYPGASAAAKMKHECADVWQEPDRLEMTDDLKDARQGLRSVA